MQNSYQTPQQTQLAILLAGSTLVATTILLLTRKNQRTMASTTTVFNAEMACGGCSGAITRIVKKFDGVESINCDLDAQTVTVVGSADPQAMLAKLQKWGNAAGKKVELRTE